MVLTSFSVPTLIGIGAGVQLGLLFTAIVHALLPADRLMDASGSEELTLRVRRSVQDTLRRLQPPR